MDQNKTFVGTINGKTYDSLEDYNKAFLDAVGKGRMVTASIEFKPENIKHEQYDHCLPDFDLDELTGVAGTDTPIIDDFIKQELSADRIKEILDRASKMSTSDCSDLDADVKDMIESINSDIEDNRRAHSTLLKNKADNERDINQLRAKLDELKERGDKIQTQINITEGADRVLRATIGFYNTLYKYLNRMNPADGMRNQDAKVTGRTVKKGNPGFILDHDQKEVARKLFKEIFGI